MPQFSIELVQNLPNRTELNQLGSVKDESLGLKTKGIETLGLVLNFGTCLVSVSSRMKILGQSRPSLVPVSSQSRPGLVLFASVILSLVSVSA